MAVALRRPTDVVRTPSEADLRPQSWPVPELKAHLACAGFDVAAPLCVDWCAHSTPCLGTTIPAISYASLVWTTVVQCQPGSPSAIKFLCCWKVLGAVLSRVLAPEQKSWLRRAGFPGCK